MKKISLLLFMAGLVLAIQTVSAQSDTTKNRIEIKKKVKTGAHGRKVTKIKMEGTGTAGAISGAADGAATGKLPQPAVKVVTEPTPPPTVVVVAPQPEVKPAAQVAPATETKPMPVTTTSTSTKTTSSNELHSVTPKRVHKVYRKKPVAAASVKKVTTTTTTVKKTE
jgi:hypothetical protein